MTNTATAPRYTATIQDEPARPIDHMEIWHQIGHWTRVRVGLTDLVYSEKYVQFDVRCDRAKRRIIITLAADDTYSIEIGKVHRKTFAWISQHIARSIYADDLSAAIERAYEAGFDA